MANNVKISIYDDSYREQTIAFLIKIAIDEFGFEEWRNYFQTAKFLELQNDRENFWIATNENNEVVGTIGITDDNQKNIAKLHSLYVRPDYRKNKIATSLYNKALAFCIKKNYTTIILHTYTVFENAIKFYEKLGFKLDPTIKSSDGFWYTKNIENTSVWNDYFTNIRNKYNMRVSLKNPLIINLDGKGITKNVFFSLLDTTENGFLDLMEKSVKYFTTKYHCYAIFGTDEVSFIILNPADLISDINSNMNNKADEIVSMFSQYFYDYFMSLKPKEKVFWHGEVLSIPENKLSSYIKYKSGSIRNVITTYFLKKHGIKNSGNIPLEEKIRQITSLGFYNSNVKEIENGILYFDGIRYDVNGFIQNNSLIKLDSFIKKQEFFGLDDF